MRKLLTIAILLYGLSTSAQIKFGISGGANFSNLKVKDYGVTRIKRVITRLQAGTLIVVPLHGNWLLHTGPYYSQKGFGSKTNAINGKDSVRTHLHYIELPVQLMYRISEGRPNNILVGGGLYGGYGFNGEIFYEGSPGRTERHLHRKDSDFTRWDFGYSLNASYEIQNKYGVKMGFSHSILNIAQGSDRDYQQKNFVYNLSFYYFLGKRKTKID